MPIRTAVFVATAVFMRAAVLRASLMLMTAVATLIFVAVLYFDRAFFFWLIVHGNHCCSVNNPRAILSGMYPICAVKSIMRMVGSTALTTGA